MGRAKAKKKKKAAKASRGRGLVRFLAGPGRPLAILALVVVALAAGWSAVWNGSGVQDYLLGSDQYIVGPEQVVITQQPDWIHSDLRAEVFRNASLDGPLSIMDDDLTQRLAQAFSLHPWIARVDRVTKSHPSRVDVELVYRRPACIVEVRDNWLPVDAHSVLLPREDFSQVEASRYPLVVGIRTLPVGATGDPWGDGRVVGAAEIADAMRDVWSQFQLARIVPTEDPNAPEPTFMLVTRGGTRIFWGLAPGTRIAGELPVKEKIARLENYLAEYGTLEGRQGSQQLDIRRLGEPRVSARPGR